MSKLNLSLEPLQVETFELVSPGRSGALGPDTTGGYTVITCPTGCGSCGPVTYATISDVIR